MTPLNNNTLDEALKGMALRVCQIRDAVGIKWPYLRDADAQTWDVTFDGDWCAGHWIDCLRISSEVLERPELAREAAQRTAQTYGFLLRDDMFRGHRFYYGAARQFQLTGQQRHRDVALAAAWNLRTTALPSGAMPVGTQVQVRLSPGINTNRGANNRVAVDNVHPALMLDWWAAKQTGDPRFVEGARRHLDLTLADFVREDGSTRQFIDYSVATGQKIGEFAPFLADEAGCWSRGLSWAIGGFLRGWEETDAPTYLEAARKMLRYWCSHTDEDLVPLWDCSLHGRDSGPKDTSASAVVFEALARLAVARGEQMPADLADLLHRFGHGLLAHCERAADGSLALVDGCFNQPLRFGTRAETVWGTAYLMMGLSYLRSGRVPG